MLKMFSVLAVLFMAIGVLSACGSDDSGHGAHNAASGDVFNDADIEFATGMIQHHAQALQMVDMTVGRQLDPEVRSLAEDIRAAQAPEIEQMTDWLNEWDQPVPETMRDHANAHGDGAMTMDSELPGMMSATEMEDLEAADDAQFQRMWLDMMIEHHGGAIEMAQQEQSAGKFAPAVELARAIESSQQDEISIMKGMPGS